MIEFAILGPLEVRSDGAKVALGGKRPRALLAILLLHANEAVSAERLADELWAGAPPATAANALQVYVSRLRKGFPDGVLVTRGAGYALEIEPESLDLARFERFAKEGREALVAGDPATALARLTEALVLWRGPPLADLAYEPFVQSAAGRLEEERLAAIEDRIEAELGLGHHGALAPELEELVAAHPLRERLRGQLMVALYRSGRQADALEAYRRARAVLRDELGLEPSRALQQLEREILAQAPELDAPAARAKHRPSSLPLAATPIVGRTRELEEAARLLEGGARLLTFTGPGGIGKTRLALEVAHAAASSYDEGAYFVGLATVDDPSLVAPTILQALALAPDAELAAALAGRELLLFLDNFEQLITSAPLLTELLAGVPALTLLVTSRKLLRVSGERELPVPPLDEGAELFVERALAVAPDLDAVAHAAVVREICERLEGIPLAIELAAARTRILPPAALLERLASRLELLTAGPRDAPERQRTMRAATDWSYRLLEPQEQILFARLGVFVGGATLAAAAAVCGEVATLDALESLVDSSLLRRRGADEPRLVMLETLREYALEQLAAMGEDDLLRRRHAEFFLGLARETEPTLSGPDSPAALARLEAEQANLRTAVVFAIGAGDGDTAVGLAAALRHFWWVHGHVDEGLRLLEAVADGFPDAPALDRNKVLNGAGILLGERGDFAASRTRFEQALEVARAIGAPQRTGAALVNLGNLSLYGGRFDEAHELYAEALAIYEEAGDAGAEAFTLENLGLVELGRGDTEAAIETFERGIARAEAGRAPREVASVSIPLARTLIDRGELERPRALLTSALATARELGDRHKTAECMEAFARLVSTEGASSDAAALLGAAGALRDSIGAVRHGDQSTWYEVTVEQVRAALGDGYDAEMERGRRLSEAEAAELCGSGASKAAYSDNQR